MLAANERENPVSTGMTPPSSTVVLIHGLWMTPLAWEHWVERYEARGCTVLTPGYPGIGQDEAGLRALRGDPDLVAGIGVREVMDYLTEYIGKLDVCPVIMGHSFGGTFAQLLVGNGLGSARRIHRWRGREGNQGAAVVRAALHLSRTEEPGQQQAGRRPEPGAVPLRVHEHADRRSVQAGLRPVRGTHAGPDPVPGWPGQRYLRRRHHL